VICLCGKRQSAPLQSEFSVFACLEPAYNAERLQLVQARMRRRRGRRLAGLWEDRDGMPYINLCFLVILILSTHEVRDNIVTCRKHFPHLSCRKAIKTSASQYYVTVASILSNPQTIRSREFSCLCRKVERLWIFISWRSKFLWCYDESKCFGEVYWPISEYGGNIPLRNVGSYLTVDTAQYYRRLRPSWNNFENLHPSFILF